MEIPSSSLSKEETLQVALRSGILDIDEISIRIEKMRREEVLSNHPYSIWYSETDSLWKTYLPDSTKKNGRVFRKRKTKEELEDTRYKNNLMTDIVQILNGFFHQIIRFAERNSRILHTRI